MLECELVSRLIRPHIQHACQKRLSGMCKELCTVHANAGAEIAHEGQIYTKWYTAVHVHYRVLRQRKLESLKGTTMTKLTAHVTFSLAALLVRILTD